MIPKRPYFLRAFYDWISDSGLTPHLVVDANYQGVSVPQAHVENGRIVLNASMQAVQSLVLDDEYVSFSARFSGKPFNLYLPIYSILGIYAAENGEGIVLAEMDGNDKDPAANSPTAATVNTAPPPPKISAVRSAPDIVETASSEESSSTGADEKAEKSNTPPVTTNTDEDKSSPSKKKSKRPHLQVVK